MAAALTERVLELWGRGAGLDVNAWADLALELIGVDGEGANGRALYQRDRALVELRRVLFGSALDGVVRCPACHADFELRLDLGALLEPAPLAEPVSIEVDDCVAIVRPPRSDDLRGWDADLPDAGEQLFARCVVSASRGSQSIPVAELPPTVRAHAATAMSARGMESPSLDLVCGECAHAWRAPLDIARALLGELDGWVARLLDDVHRIAAAYHWSERDIMALPIRRRLHYLEAIG